MAGRNAIGIDIGGTRTRAAVISAGGAVLARAECATPALESPEVIVAAVARLVQQVAPGPDHGGLRVAGVCAPGPLDAPRGLALLTPTIGGFRDFPLRDAIAAAIGLPCFLDHDGHAAAYAEWRFGAGRGSQNMVFVTVSTGIGGGAIVDGALQRGSRGMAAHVGHMIVQPDGPLCSCGNTGCWEALAAGPAFAAAARARGFADGAAVFAAAPGGDAAALDLIRDQARWLAIGLVSLLHIYSPEVVVLGGGVASGLDLMRPFIEAEIAWRAMAPFRDIPVRRAALDQNAGLVGAAALAAMQADAGPPASQGFGG